MKAFKKTAGKIYQGAIKTKRLVNFSNTKHSTLSYAKDFYQEIKQEQNQCLQSNIAKPLNPNTKSFL